MASDLPGKFVVLRHYLDRNDPAPDHYDLMILDPERAGSAMPLETWRLDSWGIPIESRAIRIEPHREKWLHQDGELGNDRGYVTRVTGGDCRLLEKTATCWKIRFPFSGSAPETGTRKGGEAVLELVSQSSGDGSWSMIVRIVEPPEAEACRSAPGLDTGRGREAGLNPESGPDTRQGERRSNPT